MLNYDPLALHAYLETIVVSNTLSSAGNPRQNQSSWLLSDAAHIIFETAKKRCYVLREASEQTRVSTDVIDISDDEDAWEALDEVEGRIRDAPTTTDRKDQDQTKSRPRPTWLPKSIEPVLEELPKWHLLAETLKEIEEEIMRQESLSSSASR